MATKKKKTSTVPRLEPKPGRIYSMPGRQGATVSGARRNRYAVLDLFSGAGGMALGFQAAGARCIAAVELDRVAAATFQANFEPDDPRVFAGPASRSDPGGDVTRLSVEHLLGKLEAPPDVVIGGPPCQGFSRIGRAKHRSLAPLAGFKRHGTWQPERNELYHRFLDVVRQARPMAFVMENVPGIREHLGVDMALRIAEDAERRCDLLYNVRYFLLNAAWYGVPQQRWRIFFVGIRSDLGADAVPAPPPRTHHVPEEFPDGATLPDDPRMLWGRQLPVVRRPRPQVTVHEAIGDLPRLAAFPGGERPLEGRRAYSCAPSEWARLMRQWPGLPESVSVSGNWYRWTPRDFPIFQRMAHGDRYPEALSIAQDLFLERMAELQRAGAAPPPGSEVYARLRRGFIPPYRNDAFHDKWAKLHPDKPSWTLTAHLSKDSYSHIHYDSSQARTLTVREAARLQSFPDSFEFCGNFGDQLRQIGNAVPPLLATAIADTLFRQLDRLQEARRRRARVPDRVRIAALR